MKKLIPLALFILLTITAAAQSLSINTDGSTANAQTDGLKVGPGNTFANIQSGTLTVGSNASGSMTVTLSFPAAFASTPKVIATAHNQTGSSFGDTFGITIRSVSTTAVTFNIQRIDTNASWAQTLQLDWMALQ